MGGITALDDNNLYGMIQKWSAGNKIAVFTLDPNAQYDCYIINEDLGHWDNEGNWWSNDGYKANAYSKYFNYYGDGSDIGNAEDDYDNGCWSCGATVMEDGNPYHCHACATCFDCGLVRDEGCMCWSPEYDAYRHKQTIGGYSGQYDFGF
jgi:hypothetical protein